MGRKYWFDVLQMHCPICINHLLPNAFLSASDVIGERIKTLFWNQNSMDERVNYCEKVFGEALLPFSFVMEEEIFMNRPVLKTKFFVVSAFRDEFINWYFKKKYLGIEI